MAHEWASRGNVSLVWADEQTTGRGRNDRDWNSKPGGLYYSLRYPLEKTRHQPTLHLLLGAYAWVELLDGGFNSLSGLSVKWPNDILIGGRKLGGVLADVKGKDMVLGIGININNTIDIINDGIDRPATSLIDELGRATSRRGLLFRWIDRYHEQLEKPDATIMPELEDRMDTLGRKVRSGGQEGKAVGLDEDGGLVLESAGHQFVVHAGDSVEVPMPS